MSDEPMPIPIRRISLKEACELYPQLGTDVKPTLTEKECAYIKAQIPKFDAKNATSLDWLAMSTNLEDALTTIEVLRKTLDLAQELHDALEDKIEKLRVELHRTQRGEI